MINLIFLSASRFDMVQKTHYGSKRGMANDAKAAHTHTHTHPFNGPFRGLPRWAGTRKVKPIWILLKQETVSGSGISWAICKSAPRSRQITTPTPQHSVFYRPDALPAAQPTASKHANAAQCIKVTWVVITVASAMDWVTGTCASDTENVFY